MKVTTIRKRPIAGRYLERGGYDVSSSSSGKYMTSGLSVIRFERIGHCIQPVLDLAGLLADSIQRAGIVCCIISPRSAKGILVAEVVARSATDLGHSGAMGEDG